MTALLSQLKVFLGKKRDHMETEEPSQGFSNVVSDLDSTPPGEPSKDTTSWVPP